MDSVKKKNLLIWGAGDQGTVTLDCALSMNVYSNIDFLDFKEKGHRDIPGYSIYKEDEVDLSDFLKGYDEIIVASGDNNLREQKTSIIISFNVPLSTIIHPTAVVSRFAKISRGCTVLAGAIINVNAQIGVGCIINNHVDIEHDCVVGDYVNICPNVAMAGHTKIGDKSFLGTGCNIIDQINIGKSVIVGAGAAVIRDVPDEVTVVGVPARQK